MTQTHSQSISQVQFSVHEGVARLVLAHEAKLNALTVAMIEALETHLRVIDRDPNIRSVILTGQGEKAFCCGADISGWGSLSAAEFARYWVREGHRVFDALARLSKPTIAAINGYAFGGGLELASCCDIRLMAPNAALALPETRIGIVPGWSGTQRLTRLLPESAVKEMVLFGTRLSAERAVTLGYAAQICEDVQDIAFQLAQQTTQLSPRAVETAKYMIHAAVDEDRAAMVEVLGSAAICASEDRKEGVEAFLNKRQPNFSGK